MITPQELFRALADMTRLRVLLLMQSKGELCVCQFTQILSESQPKISRHLAHLREVGLVSDRRQGQWVHYRINPDLPKWASQIILETAEGLLTEEPFNSDVAAVDASEESLDKQRYG